MRCNLNNRAWQDQLHWPIAKFPILKAGGSCISYRSKTFVVECKRSVALNISALSGANSLTTSSDSRRKQDFEPD
jgi:hypothetical protein